MQTHIFCYLAFYFSGFSKQITAILKDANVKYSSFNILEDEEVRQGTFS